MDDINSIIQKLKVSTNCINSKTIQDVLIAASKYGKCSEPNQELWNEIAQILWMHLQTGLGNFDDQLLCATCFYTVLILSRKQDLYIMEISEIIKQAITLKEKQSQNLEISQTMSLMYGIFQSSFLTQIKQISGLSSLLNDVFNLLKLMAYEYSKYTFIVFKTINSFKKVCGTNLQECLFNQEKTVELLNLVNHNWENPITGVRDLNKGIFQTLISTIDKHMYKSVLQDINRFYWNKAKYLMLAEVANQCKQDINSLIKQNDWLEGLLYSLNKPGLVSAGADMYYAIVKKMKSEDEWCNLFLEPVITVLNNGPRKAIENFCNYWCLFTFKMYPALAAKVMEELQQLNDIEQNILYSNVSVMKQVNKLGLLNKKPDMNSNVKKTIATALVHCDNDIRMTAFNIVCATQGKAMPSNTDYKLVLDYLSNNVNSDCTNLRLNMLNSISCFLSQLHIAYINNLKNNQEYQKEELKNFFFEFQDIIITSLDCGGNYQRKIASVKLLQVFLNDVNGVPRKNQKQICHNNATIIQMLTNEGQWLMCDEDVILNLIKLLKDPAEDVRDNVVQLLLKHYAKEMSSKHMMRLLIEDGLYCLSSKFFYEISCGQSMFKLIVNLLLKKLQSQSTFNTVDDVFEFAFKELISEYNMKRDIVDSISSGKQLHSFMSILYVVLQVCHQNQHEMKMSHEQVLELLEVLKEISNQFAWEQETSTSSDFSKISDMVEGIIASSEIKNNDASDQTKLSGLHQIVLNCLWLNVKASCDLSSLLIKCQKEDSSTDICEKSLEIMSHVLETCRHKGAIEATGAALGQSIQHLTSLPDNYEISKLPLLFLKKKLDELISEAANMASVTRRGAGLSIMVHRIVSSDAKRGKPLFHYFIKKILETCNNTIDILSDVANEKDMPKAIYIHFLTRIVTDSSLASDMMFYSAELAELAFGNLTSPYWQIRNAALQLYGALIQKLIGQKKASGSHEETVATVACDELRTHAPKLWNYIQQQLVNKKNVDRIQLHSNLVPILNMIASLARRYSFSNDILAQKQVDANMLMHLCLLLDSPIYTVRRLTAKCISNIYQFKEIYANLMKEDHISENHLHGILMLILNYQNLYNTNENYKTEFYHLKTKYEYVLNQQHSYICKEVFEEVFHKVDFNSNDMEQIFVELDSNPGAIGVNLWVNTNFKKYMRKISWDFVPQILNIILNRNDFEIYCKLLSDKLEDDYLLTEATALEIARILLLSKNKFQSSIIWKILYQVSLKIDNKCLGDELFNTSEIYNFIGNGLVTYKMRFMIPYAARIASIRAKENHLLAISVIVESLTDSVTTDVDLRYIAAQANNEIASIIRKLPEGIKELALKSAIILLQDEDEDVRKMSAEFYPKIINSQTSFQPYICLLKIMDQQFLNSLLSENGIIRLANELMKYVTKMSTPKTVDEYNPFANDSSNIYLEVNALKKLIGNLNSV